MSESVPAEAKRLLDERGLQGTPRLQSFASGSSVLHDEHDEQDVHQNEKADRHGGGGDEHSSISHAADGTAARPARAGGQGHAHRFDALSGWCMDCDYRDDGRLIGKGGVVYQTGPDYTPAQIAGFLERASRA